MTVVSRTASVDQSDNPYVGVATNPDHERKAEGGAPTGVMAIQVLRQRKSGNVSPARTAWLFDSAEELIAVGESMIADGKALLAPAKAKGFAAK